MVTKVRIALTAALVFSSACAASATTKSRGPHVHSTTQEAGAPLTSYGATAYPGATITTGFCPPSGGPSCSTACLPSGPPCKPEHDGW
jgi:hypothetical protein